MTPEADLTNVWRDAGWWVMPNGTRRLLSWNAATHELKLWALDRSHPDTVLAVIGTEDEMIRRLEGWEMHNNTRDGLSWLAQRLEGCR